MNLIFIYGKPGVGKLTVSRSLAKITGYKIFHHHMIIDPIIGIFNNRNTAFSELANRLRYEVIREAARVNVNGLIFTFGSPPNNRFVRRIINVVARYNGTVMFVMLKCKKEVLYRRIRYASRKRFSKIKTTSMLDSVLKGHDLDVPVPYKNNLIIDNTDKSPETVAMLIKKHYRL